MVAVGYRAFAILCLATAYLHTESIYLTARVQLHTKTDVSVIFSLYIKNIAIFSLSKQFLRHRWTDFDEISHEQRPTTVVVPFGVEF